MKVRKRNERGQALILVLVALSLFMIGAIGFAIDGAHLYAQRQMAQAAADAAAQAGIMSVFNGTNIGTNAFGTSLHTCTTTDAITPCVFGRNNGFGAAATDVVTVDFPSAADVGIPSGNLSAIFTPNIVRVTITRPVATTLMRFLGTTTSSVKSVAAAAILGIPAAIPIIIVHPTLSSSFSINGSGAGITITGGPNKSIQVNSSASDAIPANQGGMVDLSAAGPTGNGADFGNHGGPRSYPGGTCTAPGVGCGLALGTLPGHYVEPASIFRDPLLGVSVTSPGTVVAAELPIPAGTHPAYPWGCPANATWDCQHYPAGVYPTGITVQGTGSNGITAYFDPGIYYIPSGGFNMMANSNAAMATCVSPCTVPAGFTTRNGMLVFNTGTATGDVFNFTSNAGKKGPGINLVGADENDIYKGILFFQDRTSVKHTGVGGNKGHTIQGGGTISLTGTIYITNTAATIDASGGAQYQQLQLQGNSGSTTTITGEIITDVLAIGGTATITMHLSSALTTVQEIALVH